MKCDHCGKDVCAVFAEYDEAGKFIVICWDCHELDKIKAKGQTYGTMWPIRFGSGQVCLHRFYSPHRLSDRSKWLRTCRDCEINIVSWFDEEQGQITEKEYRSKDPRILQTTYRSDLI